MYQILSFLSHYLLLSLSTNLYLFIYLSIHIYIQIHTYIYIYIFIYLPFIVLSCFFLLFVFYRLLCTSVLQLLGLLVHFTCGPTECGNIKVIEMFCIFKSHLLSFYVYLINSKNADMNINFKCESSRPLTKLWQTDQPIRSYDTDRPTDRPTDQPTDR